MIWQMQQFKHAAVSLNSLQSTSQEVFKVYTVNSMVWIVQLKCNKTKFKHLQLPLLLYLSSSYVRCFLKKNKTKTKTKTKTDTGQQVMHYCAWHTCCYQGYVHPK